MTARDAGPRTQRLALRAVALPMGLVLAWLLIVTAWHSPPPGEDLARDRVASAPPQTDAVPASAPAREPAASRSTATSDAPSRTLTVVVTSSDGKACVGWSVAMASIACNAHQRLEPTTCLVDREWSPATTTDARGACRIEGLRAGAFAVQATDADGGETEANIADLRAGSTSVALTGWSPVTCRVRVQDQDQRPLAAVVACSRWSDPHAIKTSISRGWSSRTPADDGTCTIRMPGHGTYLLSAKHRGVESDTVWFDTGKQQSGAVVTLTIQASARRITGEVVDELGAPQVAKVCCTVLVDGRPAPNASSGVVSAADGSFECMLSRDGDYEVLAYTNDERSGARCSPAMRVDLVGDGARGRVRLVLPSLVTVAIRVRMDVAAPPPRLPDLLLLAVERDSPNATVKLSPEGRGTVVLTKGSSYDVRLQLGPCNTADLGRRRSEDEAWVFDATPQLRNSASVELVGLGHDAGRVWVRCDTQSIAGEVTTDRVELECEKGRARIVGLPSNVPIEVHATCDSGAAAELTLPALAAGELREVVVAPTVAGSAELVLHFEGTSGQGGDPRIGVRATGTSTARGHRAEVVTWARRRDAGASWSVRVHPGSYDVIIDDGDGKEARVVGSVAAVAGTTSTWGGSAPIEQRR